MDNEVWMRSHWHIPTFTLVDYFVDCRNGTLPAGTGGVCVTSKCMKETKEFVLWGCMDAGVVCVVFFSKGTAFKESFRIQGRSQQQLEVCCGQVRIMGAADWNT